MVETFNIAPGPDTDALLAKYEVTEADVRSMLGDNGEMHMSPLAAQQFATVDWSEYVGCDIIKKRKGWIGNANFSNGAAFGTPEAQPRTTRDEAEEDAARIVGLIRWGGDILRDRFKPAEDVVHMRIFGANYTVPREAVAVVAHGLLQIKEAVGEDAVTEQIAHTERALLESFPNGSQTDTDAWSEEEQKMLFTRLCILAAVDRTIYDESHSTWSEIHGSRSSSVN